MSRKGENIYKRKDGRWEARYIKEYTAEGKRKYGYCYGKTYHEAKEKLAEAKTALYLGAPMPDRSGNACFSFYCEEWLHLIRDKVKESTYTKYVSMIENHICPKLGKTQIRSMSSALIARFSHELLTEKGLAPKTVRDILTLVHAVLKFINGQVPYMPKIEMAYPKENKKEMRVLTRDEQEKFMRYLMTDPDECKFGVMFALLTGLRIGELCALRWCDISLKERSVLVHSTMQRIHNTDAGETSRTKIIITEPKSNSSLRKIPLTDYTAELCVRWKPENNDAYLLTGNSDRYIEPRCLQYRLRKYTEECGLSGVHFHTLRHTFATRCVEVDFEIKSLSEILGHSSPKVTLERYIHSSFELKRSNMNKLTAIGY